MRLLLLIAALCVGLSLALAASKKLPKLSAAERERYCWHLDAATCLTRMQGLSSDRDGSALYCKVHFGAPLSADTTIAVRTTPR